MINKLLLLIVFVVTATSAIAQSKKELETREIFWNNTNKDALVTSVPEKWKNESVVILYKSEYYSYENFGKSIMHSNYFHIRMKIQDKNAVENYSQYSYEMFANSLNINNKDESVMVGIKVIKPSGEEIIIDVEKERVQSDANGEILYKVAIPALEIGDILDIYKARIEYGKSDDGKLLLPKIERTVAEQYPVVKKKISVEVENDFFLRMESYNGAPVIKEVPTSRRVTKMYEFVASDIEKSLLERWSYPLLYQPSVKLQVVFALRKKDEKTINFFLPEKQKERGGIVTKEEILNFVEEYSSIATEGKKDKTLELIFSNSVLKTDLDVLNEIIYFLRHYKYTAWTEPIIAYQSDIYNDGMPCQYYSFINNKDKLLFELTSTLKQYNFDYEILMTKPRYDGPMSETLLRSNVEIGLKINLKDAPPVFFFDFGPYASTSNMNPLLEGTTAIVFKPTKKITTTDLKNIDIPNSTAAQNVLTEKTTININADWSGFNITRDRKYYGQQKNEGQNRHISIPNYLQEDFEYYDTNRFYNCSKNQTKSNQLIEQKLTAIYVESDRKDKETETSRVKGEFDVEIDHYDLQIIDSGRYDANAPFHTIDSLTMGSDFIKKTGPNYILEVGKFIGGQVTIDATEYDRTLPINLDYAKTYLYDITIQIPTGYSVEGIERLNKNVSNSTGAFVSIASVKDDKLIFKTSKTYLKTTLPASQWPDMMEWLNEANNFSREKVLFKKID